MKHIYNYLTLFVLSMLTSVAIAQPANNNFSSAIDITSLIGSSTSGGAFTTVSATGDLSKGSCWTNGPNNNVWFKFKATATAFINVRVKVSGSGETLRNPFVVIFDSLGNQLNCQNYKGAAVDLSLSYQGLLPYATYYIAVDNYSGYSGKFDIALSEISDYDYPQGATDLTSAINAGASTGGTYNTTYATADFTKASCWSNGTNNNRWFQFTATSTTFINVQVKVSGAGETMRNPFVAIYDSSFTQLACQNYLGTAVDLNLSYYGLTTGKKYYIMVDNYSGYAGTFDIGLSDAVDYDYPQGANNLNSRINAAATTGGTYNTTYASADRSKPSCWSNGPNNNRWFTFNATSTGFINVQVKVSGAGETMRNPFVAIYDSNFTQLTCQNYKGAAVDLNLSYYGLTTGNKYYIVVDNYSGYSGTFDMQLSDVVDYDYPQGAVNLTSRINSSATTGGTYNTSYASADNSKGTCWSNGPNNNRWFKFVATATTFINIQVKVSGAGETMRNPFVALFDNSLTQLACQNYMGAATDLSLSYFGLTAGSTYYIAVDNYSGYSGTFDMQLSDVVDYDYPQGAVNLTSRINVTATTGGTYNTTFASADRSKPSCWSNGPNNNRWFKFVATASTFINIQVKVSGAGETMRNPFLALFNSSLSQLACQNYKGAAVDLSLSYYGLTPGSTYYIAVDNYSGYAGTFDIQLIDVPDYDYPQGAFDLDPYINGGTTGGTFNTTYASPDHSKGTCWSNGPNNNRWFKFVATATTFVNVQVKVSGAGETMRNPFVALFDSSLTQIVCQNYKGAAVDLGLSYMGLTPGRTYYVAVDNYSGYAGTFDISIFDAPDYDYPQGAQVLTNLDNYASSGGAYSTTMATPDHSKGTCWSNGPNNNRWFKFKAIFDTVTVQVKVSGSGETMRNPFLALFDSNLTQLSCKNYAGAATDISITYNTLTPGRWYYISVDNYSGYSGTFDIGISNVSKVQYYAISSGSWNSPSTWSKVGYGGPSASTVPGGQSVVNIKDIDVTISDTAVAASVNITSTTSDAQLTVDNGLLTVAGQINIQNASSSNSQKLLVKNGGRVQINDNLNLSRTGGSGAMQLSLDSNSTLNITNDLIWSSTAGSTNDNELTMDDRSVITVGRSFTLSSTGGRKISVNLNDESSLSVGYDLSLLANAASMVELNLNDQTQLSLRRNLVRNATPYGSLVMASGATLTFNGLYNTQTMPGNAGSGGDGINYTNVVMNNSSGFNPDIILSGAVTITGSLTLTKGMVQTTASNILNIADGATSTSGSSQSFVSGPMIKTGTSAFVFPIGKGNYWARMGISAPAASGNQLTAEYFNTAYSNTRSISGSLVRVSNVEYWNLSESIAGDSVKITLYWENSLNSGIEEPVGNIRVVHWNGSLWEDAGNTAISGSSQGYVSSTSWATFSPFTLGTFGNDPMPVQLLTFNAEKKDKVTQLIWQTASENNSDYFVVQRSNNGIDFEDIKKVAAAGNSSELRNYTAIDEKPVSGKNIYRLKQVDYLGSEMYSPLVSVEFNIDLVSFVIYPNPVNSFEDFKLISEIELNNPVKVVIVDITGKEVFSEVVKTADNHTLNLHLGKNLAAGNYSILIHSNNKVYHQKMLYMNAN